MEFKYLEESGKKFLIYDKKEDQEMDYLTLGMLENNEIIGTLPFLCRQVDREVQFRYDISGLKSVKELFGEKTKKAKVVRFLKAIVTICEICEKYMIDITQIILSPEYILASEQWTMVQFVVLPLMDMELKFDEQLRDLVLNLEFDRTENCSYVAELLNYFQHHAEFSLVEFSDMVRRIENKDSGREVAREYKNTYQSNAMVSYNSRVQQKNREEQSSYPLASEVRLPEMEQNVSERMYPAGMNGYHLQKTIQSPVSKMELTMEDIEKQKSKKGLFSFGKKNNKGKEKQIKDKPQKKSQKQMFGNVAIPGIEDGGYAKGSIEIPEAQTIKEQHVQIQSYYVGTEDFGETMLLDENQYLVAENEKVNLVYELICISTGEKYQITKPITKIGRKEAFVDICIKGNIHVGRIHAILHIKEGKLFIEDNASVNGTFLNENHNRIQGIVELHSGDKILLGDEELLIVKKE